MDIPEIIDSIEWNRKSIVNVDLESEVFAKHPEGQTSAAKCADFAAYLAAFY